ncbi:hypothetical protein VTI28DRAFT_4338 [Corynascus sepedonium]
MYRTKHFRWKLMHLWGISAHLGLIAAVAISYLYHLEIINQPLSWSHSPTISGSHCMAGIETQTGLESENASKMAVQTLLKACLILGSGGFATNIALFAALMAVEPNKITLTEGEQHWRKQVVTFFGCSLNLLLAGAGFCLAINLSTKATDIKSLIAPLVWTYLQAPLALAIAVCDAIKNYREGKDLLD